jgi:GT2 family glycosyltransferase
MNKKNYIAVLLTCHNRKEKTLACLTALYSCIKSKDYVFKVFLVDDGSTDGTAQAIKDKFPQVHVIEGNGNLFWNRGMRLSWETAYKTQEYDFYLWLNDDTMLDLTALIELLECSEEALKKDNQPAIISGACRKNDDENEFSYGGRTEECPVVPNGVLQKCKYINGNAVLVPNKIYQKLGNLSPDYTHGMGDYDYGLRAINAGLYCYTTKTFIAVCDVNEEIQGWCNPNVSLKKRWQQFKSPIGLNINEYIVFRKKFWGYKWISFTFKAFIKMLIPRIYSNLLKK